MADFIQTNFRAQDMLGAAKPAKKAAPAPRVSAPAPKPEPVVEPVAVVEEPAAEETSTEE
jgi:hypothetical protein